MSVALVPDRSPGLSGVGGAARESEGVGGLVMSVLINTREGMGPYGGCGEVPVGGGACAGGARTFGWGMLR